MAENIHFFPKNSKRNIRKPALMYHWLAAATVCTIGWILTHGNNLSKH
jgi:hypothetical protein